MYWLRLVSPFLCCPSWGRKLAPRKTSSGDIWSLLGRPRSESPHNVSVGPPHFRWSLSCDISRCVWSELRLSNLNIYKEDEYHNVDLIGIFTIYVSRHKYFARLGPVINTQLRSVYLWSGVGIHYEVIITIMELTLLYDYRADSRFAPNLRETALLCNDVSHRLDANLESALWLYSFYILYVVQTDQG